MHAFGTTNNCHAQELCAWHKGKGQAYTFGASGLGTPDFDHTGCLLLWGHNPNTAFLAQGWKTAEAKSRGAALVVIDPRYAGPAVKADQWLRVRPVTDGALALALAGVMITEGWYDRAFMQDWSNGPFLVRLDEHRLLTAAELGVGDRHQMVAWDISNETAVVIDPGNPVVPDSAANLALDGTVELSTLDGPVVCQPAFGLYTALCTRYTPERTEDITEVPAAQIRATARLLWEARPVSLTTWTGLEQHDNATQTTRAVSLLYALTGSYGERGGNVTYPKVQTCNVTGRELISHTQWRKALGVTERPLGPPTDGWITSDDLYRAILEHQPYPVRGLVSFGSNLLMSHADVTRGSEALRQLDFYVHADLFLNPTAAYADIVLPVNTPWERQALQVGFSIDQQADELVQLRPAAVPSLGESRSDEWIVFQLACRLGLGEHFWGGDIEAAYRHRLEPSGVSLEMLRDHPEGIRVPLEMSYRKHIANGGFSTPSHRVEVWLETFRTHGYPPLPDYWEPAVSPVSRPDLAEHYPLVLTSAKTPQYCHSQHRNLPSLRKLLRDPQVEMHPETAAARHITQGDWVYIATPNGRIRARAKLQEHLAPNVVVAQHGWWQGCEPLGLPSYPALGDESANFNLLIGNDHIDPISGTVPHRSYLCEVKRLDD
jgi:anaerobic selenocysteine-containing dehydrogenase